MAFDIKTLMRVWNAQFGTTLTTTQIKNNVAMRATLDRLDKAVFGAPRNQINNITLRIKELQAAVL